LFDNNRAIASTLGAKSLLDHKPPLISEKPILINLL